MNEFSNLYLILIFSITIGMMIIRLVVHSNELYVVCNNGISNLILLWLVLCNSNVLLVIGVISLVYIGIDNISNTLLIVHFILMLANGFVCLSCMNFGSSLSSSCVSSMYVILLMISIDVISLINVLIVSNVIGSGIWYYLLFQTVTSMLIFLLLIVEFDYLLGLFYFMKLGSGVGGYYLPSFYSYVMDNKLLILIYIGVCNIILMYNPMVLLSNIVNSNKYLDLYDSIVVFVDNSIDCCSYVPMFCVLCMVVILNVWISNGYIFVNNWLYVFCISSLVLGNVYNTFAYVSICSYSLLYYLYYFTFTSVIVWFTLILTYKLVSSY